jgi:hypothetical protein
MSSQPVTPQELAEFAKQIDALPKHIRRKIMPCAEKIGRVITKNGDAGLFALALVCISVKAKVNSTICEIPANPSS